MNLKIWKELTPIAWSKSNKAWLRTKLALWSKILTKSTSKAGSKTGLGKWRQQSTIVTSASTTQEQNKPKISFNKFNIEEKRKNDNTKWTCQPEDRNWTTWSRNKCKWNKCNGRREEPNWGSTMIVNFKKDLKKNRLRKERNKNLKSGFNSIRDKDLSRHKNRNNIEWKSSSHSSNNAIKN